MTKRTVSVQYLTKGTVGDLYQVDFEENGRSVGHWPIHEEGLAGLIVEWVRDGKRPR